MVNQYRIRGTILDKIRLDEIKRTRSIVKDSVDIKLLPSNELPAKEVMGRLDYLLFRKKLSEKHYQKSDT